MIAESGGLSFGPMPRENLTREVRRLSALTPAPIVFEYLMSYVCDMREREG